MENKNCSNESLNFKQLAQKALRKDLSMDDIMSFIDKASDIQIFKNDISTFQIYFIIKTIQPLYNDIPLIKLSLQAIESQIVLSVLKDDYSFAEECEYQHHEEDYKYTPSEIERYFLDVFKKGFPPEENPGVKYPEHDGEEGDLHIPQVMGPDNQIYNLHVMIDNHGKITRFCEPPVPIQNATNYDEIYSALVGKMLDFQKEDYHG